MRRMLAVAAIGAAAVCLTGCLAWPLPTDGPVAMRHGNGGNMDALLEGTLHLDDECAWVESEYGDYLPVFEVGVARYEDGKLIYGGPRSDGDRIQVGGGETNSTTADERGGEMYIPDGCPDLTIWIAAPPFEA